MQSDVWVGRRRPRAVGGTWLSHAGGPAGGARAYGGERAGGLQRAEHVTTYLFFRSLGVASAKLHKECIYVLK